MIDYTDFDAKLEEYSEAFDIYMESGKRIGADAVSASPFQNKIDVTC